MSAADLDVELQTFWNIARYHNFTWLEEVTSSLMQLDLGSAEQQDVEMDAAPQMEVA